MAEAIGKSTVDLIKKLMELGVIATINQEIDFDTAYILAQEFDIELNVEEDEDLVERMLQMHYEDERYLSSLSADCTW